MPLGLLRGLAFEGPLTNFVREPPNALREPQVSGLHLQFDSAFLRRLSEVIYRSIRRGIEDDPTLPYSRTPFREQRRIAAALAITNFGSDSGSSLEEQIGWSHRCREMNYPKRAKPVTIVVDYGEESSQKWLAKLPSEYKGFPIRYRYSPAAQEHVGTGSGVHGIDFGTLGGILEDGVTNQFYGLTCAHVGGATVTSVFQTDSRGKMIAPLGAVVESELPPAAVGGCNTRASPGAGIDAALIALSAVPWIQPTRCLTVAPIVDVDQDDPIAFTGHESGQVPARIAAATIWKKIRVAGQIRCYGDMFSIGHRQPNYVLQTVSKAGDSGSWIFDDAVRPFSNTCWIGMLIAGDKQQNQSLGCYSEQVFEWARAKRPNLQLPI